MKKILIIVVLLLLAGCESAVEASRECTAKCAQGVGEACAGADDPTECLTEGIIACGYACQNRDYPRETP